MGPRHPPPPRCGSIENEISRTETPDKHVSVRPSYGPAGIDRCRMNCVSHHSVLNDLIVSTGIILDDDIQHRFEAVGYFSISGAIEKQIAVAA